MEWGTMVSGRPKSFCWASTRSIWGQVPSQTAPSPKMCIRDRQAGLGGDIINFVLCVVAFFVIGYFVAYFMIGKLKLATPGRLGNYTDDNADDAAADTKAEKKADKKSDNGQAERIIALLGGRENIVLVDACMTRLRVTVKDPAKVADLAAWKAEGALSLLVKGDGIQAVYGPKADVLKSDINDIL